MRKFGALNLVVVVFLIGLASLTADAKPRGRFERFCSRTDQGRSDRGFLCSTPLLEAFTAGGAGTSGVCSTTAPTGTRGEVLTFSRASSATCTKTATGGHVTSGIADGDLVTLSNDQVRVEYSAAGILGPHVEGTAATNVLLRFILISNAAWADVATPILTGSQNSPFTGTYATSAVQSNDDNAAAFEGRTQNVTVVAGNPYTMHCYVKGVTLAKARISLDGTTQDIAGLSVSSWSIVQVTDASASGVSIAAQVLNGNAAADTGTIIWGGCQVEAGSFRTTIIPTDGATATRATEGVPSFPVAITAGSPASSAVTVTASYVPTTGTTLAIPPASGNPEIVGRFSGGNFGCYMMTPATDLAAGTWAVGDNRWACTTARLSHLRGTTATGTATQFTGTIASVGIGSSGGFGAAVNGIYTQLCVDASPARCAP